MKKVFLTHGKIALVDDEDFERINKFKWYHVANHDHRNDYAVRGIGKNDKKRLIKMHNFIMPAPEGKLIDHKNGDGLDNRKINLRFCTRQQNNMNRRPHNALGLKGVMVEKNGKYKAVLGLNRKKINLGSYYMKENAALAYNLLSKLYYGEFAYSARSKMKD